jgi:phosphopantothenoylcysteine decarboxylase/phosphopantothenate--cysteine ligase
MGVSADLMLIAPLTATTLGKMAGGIADNLLVTTYLSARCPVVVAPAMDMDMYNHPSTRKNLEVIKAYGNHVIDPGAGELASGLDGKGRMEEPEAIIQFVSALDLKPAKKKLLNKKVLVTAGPTQESIDPVRYIGNHSSGIMGYAIAEAFANTGATVSLVSGPVNISLDHPRVEITAVTTAGEMYKACKELAEGCDIAVFNAAVADFTPVEPSGTKVKRGKEDWTITLKPTRDIAGELGHEKRSSQLFVGFALETDHGIKHAKGKLESKNLDLIVLNAAGEEGAGFGTATNRVTMIDRTGHIEEYEMKPKIQVANDLVSRVIKMIGYA